MNEILLKIKGKKEIEGGRQNSNSTTSKASLSQKITEKRQFHEDKEKFRIQLEQLRE